MVLEQIDTVERILDRYLPEWRERRKEWTAQAYEFDALRTAAIRCKSRLQDLAEVAEHLGPLGPSLSVQQLHPWIWDVAKSLWDDSHYVDAVSAAAEELDRHVQAKIDNRQRTGANLWQSAYSENDPKPDAPRLRPPAGIDPGSQTWGSLLHGARDFGKGAAQLIRNIATHERDMMDQDQCLEALAALSLLARRVESDRVVRYVEDQEQEDE